MAAPSYPTTTWPATISAAGEASGLLLAIQTSTPSPPAILNVGVSGTYSGTLTVRGRPAGGSNYYFLSGVDAQTNAAVNTGGSISLTDNTSYLFRFVVAGMDQVEIYAPTLASGDIVVDQSTSAASVVSPPIVNATTTTTSLAAATTVTSSSANALAVGANGATNPVLKIDASASSVATGVSVTGAAAASGAALAVISSGTNENLTVNAKGSGTITLASSSTGNVVVGASKLTVAPASGNTSSAGSILSTSPTAGVGYATGAGGTVTQGTSRTTGVTVNTVTGAITLVSAAGSATASTFTVTNSAVAATDTIVVNQKSGTDKYIISVTAVGAGSFAITSYTTGGTTTEQPVFSFNVIKGVTS